MEVNKSGILTAIFGSVVLALACDQRDLISHSQETVDFNKYQKQILCLFSPT